MSFYSIKLLWLLVLIPVLYGVMVFLRLKKRKNLALFADERILPRIAPELDWKLPARKNLFWLFSLIFLVIAIARPQWGLEEEVIKTSGLDVLVLLDLSNSMLTEDVAPNRLKKAKHAIRMLAEQVHGDRVGIVAFAGSAFVACPLTTDIPYVEEMLDILDPKDIQNQGTNFAAAIDTAVKSFSQGAEDNHIQGSRAVMIFSDGEDHETGALEEIKKLRDLGVKLFVFGVGTEKGGPIPVRDENGEMKGYKRDRQAQTVVSQFHPKELEVLASAGSGVYSNLTDSEVEIASAVGDLSGMTRTDYQEKKVIIKKERYQFPLFISLIFALIEISLPMRRRLAFLALAGFFLSTPSAHAVGVKDYYQNEKAKKALEKGKVDEAAPLFEELSKNNPESSIAKYNQGVLSGQTGDYSSSVGQFQEAAKRALLEKNPELATKSLFNAGVVQEKAGDLDGAIDSYLQSIRAAERLQNQDLATSARKNLELIQQQKEQKQNQSKDDEKKQDKNQDQDENDKKKDQQKKYQDPSKNRRQFKSQKLEKEDAEKVLADLSQHEKKLKDKLNQKKGVSQMTGDKDW